MKLKALVTALVLGTTSIAMAKPAPLPYRPVPAQVTPHHEVVLASKVAFTKVQNSRQVVTVSGSSRFTKLQITGISGRTSLDSVVITYANGEKQTLRDLNKLIVDNQSMTIDLQGRSRDITKITLVGESAAQGRYPSRRPVSSALMITAS